MVRLVAALVALFVLTTQAVASDPSWRDVTPRLEGCWEGTGLDGWVAECWIVAEDGRADGLFLLRQNGQPSFAEILVIDDFGDGPQMRLKHVNADMTGWEEKDEYLTFRLIDADSDTLSFKGLILHFPDDDTLKTELQMRMSDGETRTMPFHFMRTATLTATHPTTKDDLP